MSTTKNGRIRKALKFNLRKIDSNTEAERPRMSQTANCTVYTKDAEGKVNKTSTTIVIVVNTHGRNARRAKEIERLNEALKGGSKKGRMRKFAHKKDKAKEDKPKKGKGKK